MSTTKQPKVGDLKVWWIPQIPGEAFEVPVSSIADGVRIMDILANYDQFQLDQNVKPDYCNTGGIVQWEGNAWYDVDEDKVEECRSECADTTGDVASLLMVVNDLLKYGTGGEWPEEAAEGWDQAVAVAETLVAKMKDVTL